MIDYRSSGWAPTLRILSQGAGSKIPAGLMVSIPSGLMAILLMNLGEDFHSMFGANTLRASQLWSALGATLTFMIGFRNNKAYGRFWDGTSLLHQMWGEWFDAVSCLIAFSRPAKKSHPEEVQDFRHTLVRLMSLAHASALEEIAQTENDPEGYPCIDVGGLNETTLQYLIDCKRNKDLNFNRVEVIIHMIQNLIVAGQENGTLKIPPPILSRVFQTLSRGQVNLANCKKITFTLFPFPYAQVIAALLVVFTIMTPFVMASILENESWAFIFSIIPTFGFWSLNYIAQELEIPFGNDPNDLPLVLFQEHMNQSMLMLSREAADIIPGTGAVCHMDYMDMKGSISTKRPRQFLDENKDRLSKSVSDISLGESKSTPSGNVALLPGPEIGAVAQKPPTPVAQAHPEAPQVHPPEVTSAAIPLTEVLKVPDLQKDTALLVQSLGQTFEVLLSNTARLTSQLSDSSNTFQDFTEQVARSTEHASRLNKLLGQSVDNNIASKLSPGVAQTPRPGERSAAGCCGPNPRRV